MTEGPEGRETSPALRLPHLVPLALTLSGGLLVWVVQGVLRPLTPSASAWWLLLGPAPDFLVGLTFPLVGLVPPGQSLRQARRAVAGWAAFTAGALVVMEIVRPIRGADTFDPLDLVAALLGAAAGAFLGRWLAPRWAAPARS